MTRTDVNISDSELEAFMEARQGKPMTRQEADLQLAAVFLTTAHRWKKNGQRLQMVRRIYKDLCEEPGLLDELRRRELISDPLVKP